MKNYAKKYLSLFVAVLMAVMMLIPSAVFADSEGQNIPAKEFTITPAVSFIKRGHSVDLTASYSNDPTKNLANVTWNLESPELGTITLPDDVDGDNADPHATFQADVDTDLAQGKQVIVATNADGQTAKAVVYVYTDDIFEEMILDHSNLLVKDSDATLKATKPDGTALTNPSHVVWTSADESIATVTNETGASVQVHPVKTGITTVTATYLGGDNDQELQQKTCTVYVQVGSDLLINNVYINDQESSEDTIDSVGDAYTFTVSAFRDKTEIPAEIFEQLIRITATPGNIIDTPLSDADQDGTYETTAKAVGRTQINAVLNDNTAINANLKLTVSKNPVATIKIYENSQDKTGGVSYHSLSEKDASLIAELTGRDQNAKITDDSVTWTSSAEGVASVTADENDSKKATVTLNGYGKTVITVTANDGKGATASYELYVEGIKFNSDSIDVNKGDSFILPYGYYKEQNNGTAAWDELKWSSSDTSKVTVDQNGKITAVDDGSAVITVTDGKYSASITVNVKDLGQAVYRVYNNNSGEHFYTTNVDEKDHLVSLGWKDEAIGWYGTSEDDGLAVYRLYNKNGGEHHYTTSESEKDMLVKAGWSYEGIEFYVSKTKTDYPVYRNYNPNAYANNHNFTTSKNEYEGLIDAGWKDEGIAFYAVYPGSNG